MGYFFHFPSLYPATYIELYTYVLAYSNFKAVLVLPKTACSAQTHKSISFTWIVRSTLYVYLFEILRCQKQRAATTISQKQEEKNKWMNQGNKV